MSGPVGEQTVHEAPSPERFSTMLNAKLPMPEELSGGYSVVQTRIFMVTPIAFLLICLRFLVAAVHKVIATNGYIVS